jgi:hypothetical protein
MDFDIIEHQKILDKLDYYGLQLLDVIDNGAYGLLYALRYNNKYEYYRTPIEILRWHLNRVEFHVSLSNGNV